MFSNITSYIFGGEESENETGQNQGSGGSPSHYSGNPIPPLSDGEEEWVVVAGGNDQPSLTLGSLNEVNPRPPTGSTGSSSTPSDDGIDVDPTSELPQEDENPNSNRQTGLSRTERKFANPFGSCPSNGALSISEIKGIRAAQKSRDKDKKKTLSAKAIDRHNKAVKQRNQGPKKNQSAHLSIKSAGINKQLKQC
jgi:hypothetical protein